MSGEHGEPPQFWESVQDRDTEATTLLPLVMLLLLPDIEGGTG